MQTNLADLVKDTREGKEADAILRTCVHCGFCLASCPTYQLLDDELDSPRGRIYLMKEVLEGQVATQKTQLHLDRCLTCRACETACPSGVRYGRLIDICRNVVEKQVERSVKTKVIRYTLRQILPNLNIFMVFLKIGQAVKPLLPKEIRGLIPSKSRDSGIWPPARHKRKMLVLDGCVQPSIAPNINAATARILDKIGISLIKAEKENCCAIPKLELGNLDAVEDAKNINIPILAKLVDEGWDLTALIPSCVIMFKQELPLLFSDNKDVQLVSKAICDPFEYLLKLHNNGSLMMNFKNDIGSVFYQVACHQRVQNIGQVTKKILELVPNTKINALERCSGHDGTYGVKVETHEIAIKIAMPIVREYEKLHSTQFTSDCTLAAHHVVNAMGNKVLPTHPIALMRKAYGL